MGQDYIRTARVKGLPEWKVILKHGVRASLTPVVTLVGLDLGSLLGGAVITETVFNLQGIGQWAVNSVFQGDLPAVLAVTVVVALAVTPMSLIVDIVYALPGPQGHLHLTRDRAPATAPPARHPLGEAPPRSTARPIPAPTG